MAETLPLPSKIIARWACKIKDWEPTFEQYEDALLCVQAEERDRIKKSRFFKTVKLRLVGRLLLRWLFCSYYKLDWKTIKFGRTPQNKPILLSPEMKSFVKDDYIIDFNISHHGDWVVLVAAEIHNYGMIGVDLMKVEEPHNETIEIFFNALEDKFSDYEWSVIRAHKEASNQLHRFYRYWCLKESYVKALGLGLGMDLRKAEFHFSPDEKDSFGETKMIKTRTRLLVDNQMCHEWQFEESYLDDDHCFAIAYNRKKEISDISITQYRQEFSLFKLVDVNEILSNASHLNWT
ncbi:hypothetical protein G9A89_019120 [Geosiphon pyriformis]|nr:hypothetical protein G9A89_019120 [Geosiphon pyriformis]